MTAEQGPQFDTEAVDEAVDSLNETIKTFQRLVTELQSPDKQPRKVRRLYTMAKFASLDSTNLVKDAIPVNKRGPRSTE